MVGSASLRVRFQLMATGRIQRRARRGTKVCARRPLAAASNANQRRRQIACGGSSGGGRIAAPAPADPRARSQDPRLVLVVYIRARAQVEPNTGGHPTVPGMNMALDRLGYCRRENNIGSRDVAADLSDERRFRRNILFRLCSSSPSAAFCIVSPSRVWLRDGFEKML